MIIQYGSGNVNQENIGKLIREIRLKNHLTQKEFAEKYGVTYQAVSKWETGKNIPDISLLQQISKDFHIPLESMLEGTNSSKSKYKKFLFFFLIFVLFIFIFLCVNHCTNKDEFEFKTLSTSCNGFDITGSIAYNDKKSSIYISNIEYCGEEDIHYYSKIECILYESYKDVDTKISTNYYDSDSSIRLDDYLKSVSFHIDNYDRTCENYSQNSLYLQINATDIDGEINSYRIPLSLSDNCSNYVE